METYLKTLEQAGLNSGKSEPSTSVSLYRDDILTPEAWAEGVAKMKKAFPALPVEWYDILTEQVKEMGFTSRRFLDAVKHTIRTCVYPTPTVANILSFDRCVKTLTYYELKQKISLDKTAGDDYIAVDVSGCCRFALKSEVEAYGLKLWQPRQREEREYLRRTGALPITLLLDEILKEQA